MKMASTLIVAAVIAFSGIFLPAPYGISLGQSQPPRLADSKSDENAMERQIIAKEREGLDALKTGA